MKTFMGFCVRSALIVMAMTTLAYSQEAKSKKDAVPVPAAKETKDDPVAKLVRELRAKDARMRLRAANGLKDLGTGAADAAGMALCQASLDSSAAVREAAFQAIEKVLPDLYKHLVTLAFEKDGAHRLQSINALAEMKEKASPAAPILVHLFKMATLGQEPSSAVPYVEAIAKINAKDPATIKVLSEAALLAAPPIRGACMKALGDLCADDDDLKKQVFPVFRKAIFDPDPSCSIQALKLAPAFRAFAKDALPALQKLKLANNQEIREAAAKAIAEIEKK